jgi:hypothetical protein
MISIVILQIFSRFIQVLVVLFEIIISDRRMYGLLVVPTATQLINIFPTAI